MDALRNVRAISCNESERPAQKQRCHRPPNCSCRDLKHNFHYHHDGEYELSVAGKNVSIYCHNMHSHEPREYLTLKAGDTENYALYFGNRSRDLSQCSYDTSDTFDDQTVPGGTTRFSKVRVKLNVDHVQVMGDDFQFALSSGRRNQTFGSAGDCFSNTRRCPRGVFHINVEGTGLRINPRTEWTTDGQHSVIAFHTPLAPPYYKVIGQCGGYCGKCVPTKHMHLDVL